MTVFVPRPVLPEDGFTGTITCRTSPKGGGRRHPITISQDWQLTTPHDLEAERIAVALGGFLTCVDVEDKVIPAVRGLLEHRLRVRPADIQQDSTGKWRIDGSVRTCACHDGWATPHQAAAHLRLSSHWGRRFDVAPSSLTWWARFLVPGLEDDPALPASADDASWCVQSQSDLQDCWDAGLHPDFIPMIHAELAANGEPLPAVAFIVQAYALHPDWLPSFAPLGEMVVSWAARTKRPRDDARPDERLAWVESGVSLPAIAQLMEGRAYQVADALEYARLAGVSVHEAGRMLGRWQHSGVTPKVEQAAAVHRVNAFYPDVPNYAAVGRTMQLAHYYSVRPSKADVALALARTGNTHAAAAELREAGRGAPE